jgi:formylglycine-generating enzyme required for sulfatase activity
LNQVFLMRDLHRIIPAALFWLLTAPNHLTAQAPTDDELRALERQIEEQEQAEAKRRAEAEAKRKAEEEAKRKAEEERIRAEEEARRKEEEAKRLAEEEAKKREAGMRTPGTVFRDKLKDGSDGPEMVVIPAGSFTMGDEIYGPPHNVTIAKPFAMGKYEVTFEDYDRFANAVSRQLPDDAGWGRGKQPVIYVSWDDAVAYAQWLSDQTGKRYRLPSEAEWEYACRSGGRQEEYCGGNDPEALAWYEDNSGGTTHPVGQKSSNGLGLHDMSGNVWEWVQDCWNDSYNGAPGDGSAWTSGDCSQLVGRGGSWGSLPAGLRSASRFWSFSVSRYDNLGFRLVQDL